MFWKTVKTALRSLWANKLRSFLAVLGIVIGVSAVIIMIAMGKGAEKQITSSLTNLGTNLIFVSPGFRAAGAGHARNTEAQTLILPDMTALASLPHIRAVAPDVTSNFQVKFRNKNRAARVVGTWPEYLEVRNYGVDRGRFFVREEVSTGRRVCVLGKNVAEQLFGYVDPIGEVLKIDRKNFEVIGVMEAKGGMRWMNFDEFVYVPITTAMTRLVNRKHLDQIIVSIDEPENVPEVTQLVEAAMRKRHKIAPGKNPDFSISSMTDWLQQRREMSQAFTFLLAGIAGVSLLVGGIGIMNIMLVTVTERTREIGIRKAVGARRSDILRQFLIESVTISVLGGGIGILVGVFGADWVAQMAIWQSFARGEGTISSIIVPESIALAFGFSCFVGIFFGIYPALKASRLAPVDALRYE